MHEHTGTIGWMGWIAVGATVGAAAILIGYLIKRPALVGSTKLILLVGLGVLPILSAGSVNIQGFQAMESRRFCGSCHVMKPYERDSDDPKSVALASIHGKNANFGEDNCYTCHADYGMYGFVLTKLGGMRHVYYQLTEFGSMSLDESRTKIHIRAPFPNATCMSCHTTNGPRWQEVPDHDSALEGVRSDRISCASAGCHGYAHPWTKNPQQALP